MNPYSDEFHEIVEAERQKRLDELRFAEELDEAIELLFKVREEGGIEHIRPLCLLFEDKVEKPVQLEFLIEAIYFLIAKDVKQGIKEVVNSLPDIHKRGDEWIYDLHKFILLNHDYFEAYVEEVKHSDIEIKK